jgi:type IV secretory pathway VirB10-like protein
VALPQAGSATYLNHTRTPPLSDTEIKAGTVIPGALISRVNSDLPGQIIAQVRHNVYDTATGRYLLIPAEARLIGT